MGSFWRGSVWACGHQTWRSRSDSTLICSFRENPIKQGGNEGTPVEMISSRLCWNSNYAKVMPEMVVNLDLERIFSFHLNHPDKSYTIARKPWAYGTVVVYNVSVGCNLWIMSFTVVVHKMISFMNVKHNCVKSCEILFKLPLSCRSHSYRKQMVWTTMSHEISFPNPFTT